MDLFYNSLILEITNKCTAKCDICYQSAGGVDACNHLNLKVAKRCIREAFQLDCLKKRFHLAGGEAFIYPDDCYDLFSYARKIGYETISCTTNAFWARKLDHARRMCEMMRKSGLDYVEISWDYWHYQFVSPDSVNNCIRACFENEIRPNLRLLATKRHKMNEVMDLLDPEVIPFVDEISSGAVANVGRANMVCEKELYKPLSALNTSCYQMLNLCVNPKGFVYPCCSGLEVCCDFVNEGCEMVWFHMMNDDIV